MTTVKDEKNHGWTFCDPVKGALSEIKTVVLQEACKKNHYPAKKLLALML